MRIPKPHSLEWSWLLAFALGVAALNGIVSATSTPADCSLGVCPPVSGTAR